MKHKTTALQGTKKKFGDINNNLWHSTIIGGKIKLITLCSYAPFEPGNKDHTCGNIYRCWYNKYGYYIGLWYKHKTLMHFRSMEYFWLSFPHLCSYNNPQAHCSSSGSRLSWHPSNDRQHHGCLSRFTRRYITAIRIITRLVSQPSKMAFSLILLLYLIRQGIELAISGHEGKPARGLGLTTPPSVPYSR